MYEAFYKLRAKPFQLSPDPRFYFGSKGHKRAMAYLEYGLSLGEGFIVITGDVGAGKTTLVRNLFKKLESEKQFADTSYKGKAIIFEVLSNGTLGSVYAVDTAVYNTFSYQNEISSYTNSLSVYIKSILETINEKWYQALALPVDVLEILDAPVNLSKIKVKVNSYIKIIL